MTISLPVQQTPWGDRTTLLDKGMRYAFSLDVTFGAHGTHLTLEHPQPPLGVRHLFDEKVVTMPENLRCDVPNAHVTGGDGDIGDPNDPLSTSLRMRLQMRLDERRPSREREVIDLNGDGVVIFQGGPLAFRTPATNAVSGAAFLAVSFETGNATYRWLERRQLFGTGRVTTLQRSGLQAVRLLHFTFDLYGAI
jgi:hypothetical protein